VTRVSVAVVGLGRMGRLHAANVVARVPSLQLVAVADPAASAAPAAAELGVPLLADWRELLELPELDAVLVCSPTDHHAEQIVAAAQAGKHVFCEKPLDRTLAGIDEILLAVAAAGTVLQVGFNRRADRNFAALKARLAAGEIAAPWLLKITSRDPQPQSREYVQTSGGLFLDMTIHDFDLARFLLGDVVAVSAAGAALVDPGIAGLGDVDTAITTLGFESGALGVIDNCRRAAYGYDQRIEVHGALGMLRADNESSSTVEVADESGFHRPPLPTFFLDRYGDAYVRELQAFADAIGGAPPLADGRDGQQAVAIAVAAQLSLAEQRSVALAEVLSTAATGR
jgi:myo-inositol 2-dehydrogenase/D-chiro-inositol 1-dehydrogenase